MENDTARKVRNLMASLKRRTKLCRSPRNVPYLGRFNPNRRPTEKEILKASDRMEADGELENAAAMRKLATLERLRRAGL